MMTNTAMIVLLGVPLVAQIAVESNRIGCDKEVVRPNIELTVQKHIFGELRDPTGAAFVDSKVILRKRNREGRYADSRTAFTNKEGLFDLGVVDAGKYRFLPAPHRGWRQPKEIVCGKAPECEIKLTLELSSTDQLFSGCPIQ